jgi:cell division protein FtsB
MLGPQAWQELISMEKDIRQQRKETLYKQREMRKHFMEAIAATFLGVIVIAFLAFILTLANQ